MGYLKVSENGLLEVRFFISYNKIIDKLIGCEYTVYIDIYSMRIEEKYRRVSYMSAWRGALLLLKHDMKESFSSFVFIVIGLLYLSITLVPLTIRAIAIPEGRSFDWSMDILFITILLTSLSAVGGRLKWIGWLTTPFSQKMLVWRSLPITSEQITIFRILQVLILSVCSQLFFYTVLVIGLYVADVEIVWSKLILFAVFWFSIGMILHFVYIYYELAKSPLIYSIMFYSISLLQVVFIISLAIMGKHSLIIGVYHLPLHELILYSSMALLVAGIVYFSGWRFVAKKMRDRSFIV